MKRNTDFQRRKILWLSLLSKTRKEMGGSLCIPVIPFEELKVSFQEPIAMDLRNAGFCVLGSSMRDRKPGLRVREEFISLNSSEALEVYKKHFNNG